MFKLFLNAGQLLELNVDHGSDATIVEYEPYEVGPHIIKIVHEDAHIVGSPFTCNVYDAHKVCNSPVFIKL
jgi:hypothetical protein